MLINCSNHPSSRWSENQLQAALNEYGDVIDLMFPNVNPSANADEIRLMADNLVAKIISYGDVVAHIMGEMTLTFDVVMKLKSMGIRCVASTTERIVVECDNGKKEVQFHFVRFREY